MAEMDLGELGIGIDEIELDWARRLGPATSNFGKRVFKPVHHVDAHAVFGASHRIENWLAAALGHVLDNQVSAPSRMSDLKSINAKIGSCSFSNVEAKTLKMVAPGSVS